MCDHDASAYRRDPARPPARIDPYPRRPVTVEARLARLAATGPTRYEDFFFPPATWADLDERTRRHRGGTADASA